MGCWFGRSWWVVVVWLLVVGGIGEEAKGQSTGSGLEFGKPRSDGVDIVTQAGPAIFLALRDRAREFSSMVGQEVRVHPVAFGDLFQTILNDAKGNNFFSGYVFAPTWLVDLVPYLEILTPRVENSTELEWGDITSFFRVFSAQYDNEIYTIPLDGDMLFLSYRADVLEEYNLSPPATWEDYLTVIKTLQGKDFNSDGVPDYSSCIAKKPQGQSYWFTYGIVSAFIQSKGTSQGTFFDVDTMEPLVDNLGFRRAMEIYKETKTYGPPNELELDNTLTRELFKAGRCALTLDWGDVPLIAQQSPLKQVREGFSVSILPGSRVVYDRERKILSPCTADLCTIAGALGINRAPFAAFGGWSGSIPSTIPEEKKDLVFKFFTFVGSPKISSVDVTNGTTGFQMYRQSHLEVNNWIRAGFDPVATARLLLGTSQSINSPNVALDMRISGASRYLGEVLDNVVTRYLLDEIDLDQTIKELYDGWEELTDELGRIEQLTAYRLAIGLPPPIIEKEVERDEGATTAVIALSSICLGLCFVSSVIIIIFREKKVVRYSSPTFILGMIFGGGVCFVGLIIASLYPTDEKCVATAWLIAFGLTFMFANLLAKTARIYRIVFGVAKQLKAKTVPNTIVARDVCLLTIPTVILLIIWTAADIPTAESTSEGVGDYEYIYLCETNTAGKVLLGIIVGYFIFLLALSCLISALMQDVGKTVNETKWVVLSVYNFTVIIIVDVPLVFAIKEPTALFLVLALTILFGTALALCLIIAPKFFYIASGQGDLMDILGTTSTFVNTKAGMTTL